MLYRTAITRRDACGDLLVLELEKPCGYTFAAGQWFRVALSAEPGSPSRILSHAAAPGEEGLMLATRNTGSPFKRELAARSVGDEVLVSSAAGALSLPAGVRRLVVLTGGVGVSPIRSLLVDAALRGVAFDDAAVIFGNRAPACVPFLEDLRSLEGAGVRVIPVFEDAPPDAAYERGLITAGLVARCVDVARAEAFLVTGPPQMVDAMQRVLDELGVAGEARIVERFGSSRRSGTGVYQ